MVVSGHHRKGYQKRLLGEMTFKLHPEAVRTRTRNRTDFVEGLGNERSQCERK